MSTELDILRHQEEQEKVVSLYARGTKLTDIQKQLGLGKAQVDNHLAEYREFARNDKFMIARSREVVLTVDKHYSNIINEYYKTIEAADIEGDYKAKMTGLSNVAKIESDRVEFLRKAGLLAESHVGDMVAAAEEKQAILVDILKKISQKYPDVGREIAADLAQVTGEVQAIRLS